MYWVISIYLSINHLNYELHTKEKLYIVINKGHTLILFGILCNLINSNNSIHFIEMIVPEKYKISINFYEFIINLNSSIIFRNTHLFRLVRIVHSWTILGNCLTLIIFYVTCMHEQSFYSMWSTTTNRVEQK
jgi:hypothetical protein